MRRQMMLFIVLLCIALRINTVTAQDELLYIAYVVYEEDNLSEPTVRWLEVNSGEIVEPPLEGTAQCPAAWSPDQEYFIYHGLDDDGWSQYILNVETGESREFSDNSYATFPPVWSPNSELFSFITEIDDSPGISVYDVRRGTVSRIFDNINTHTIRWLSNTELAFIERDQTTLFLYKVDIFAQTMDRQRAAFEGDTFNFTLTPDWSGVVVNLNVDEVSQLHFYRWDAQELSVLGDPDASNIFPAWSPDSRHLTYFTYGEAGTGLRLLNLETGEIQILAEMTDSDYRQQVLWSPDGTRLLMMTYAPDGATEYTLLDLETNESHDIVIDGVFSRYDTGPYWVSDNILLLSAPESLEFNSEPDIYSYNANTEEVSNLTNSPEYEFFNCVLG